MSEYWMEHGEEEGFMLTRHPFAEIRFAPNTRLWYWHVCDGGVIKDSGSKLNYTNAQNAASAALRAYEEYNHA